MGFLRRGRDERRDVAGLALDAVDARAMLDQQAHDGHVALVRVRGRVRGRGVRVRVSSTSRRTMGHVALVRVRGRVRVRGVRVRVSSTSRRTMGMWTW